MIATAGESAVDSVISKLANDEKIYGPFRLIRPTANLVNSRKICRRLKLPNAAKPANDKEIYLNFYPNKIHLRFRNRLPTPITSTHFDFFGSRKPRKSRYAANSAIGNDTAKPANDKEIPSASKNFDFYAPSKRLKKLRNATKPANDMATTHPRREPPT